MSVKSGQFYELNSLRPANASFGEVVSINLLVTDAAGQTYDLGSSKRKSIHVPPSSNAYWNWMSLKADLTAWLSSNGVARPQRTVFYAALNEMVRTAHKISLVAHFGSSTETVLQYFQVDLSVHFGLVDEWPSLRAAISTRDDNDEMQVIAVSHYRL